MSNDPASIKSDQPITPPPPEHAGKTPGRLKYGVIGGIFWAAIGAALMWGFLHSGYAVFRLPEEFEHTPPMPSAEWTQGARAAQAVTRGHNTMFAVALFGALVGGFFAVGDGVARRSVSAALVGGVLCAVLAAAAGCAAGFAGHLVWKDYAARSGGMPLSAAVSMHALTFAIMGGGIGAALGCVAVRKPAAFFAYLIIGVLAGATSGMFYSFLSAALTAYVGFQGQTDVIVPTGDLNRALWVALPAVLLGSLIPGIELSRSKSEC